MKRVISCISVCLLAGCQPAPVERHYTQIETSPESSSQELAWNVPSTWQEEPGNAMRLVTFRLQANLQEIDCSIVSLGGMAGGLEANITRWLGQIGMHVSPEELQAFLQASPYRVYDFTQLQKGSKSATPSMIAAMLMFNGSTVFVKMTGSIEAIGRNKKEFLSLVKSVRLK